MKLSEAAKLALQDLEEQERKRELLAEKESLELGLEDEIE